MALVQVSNQTKCPKVHKRVLKVFWGLRAESPKRLFGTGAYAGSHQGKVPKTRSRTAQESVLGLSARRPKNTFRTLRKHFWALWDDLTLVAGPQNHNANAHIGLSFAWYCVCFNVCYSCAAPQAT